MNASYIVLDTKGTLCREVGPVLAAHGYRVQCLNFADLNTVPALAPGIEHCGYNPLRHIRRKADGRPNQQDILSVAKAICPIEDNNQPFWMRRQTCCRVLSPTSPNSYPPTSRRSARSSS